MVAALGDAYGRLDDTSFVARHCAECHCGAVRYEVGADPVAAKVCHCRNCQMLHGAPMQWAAIFHKHDVRFVRGVEQLTFYSSELKRHQALPERSLPCKVACGACGASGEGELSTGAVFDPGQGGLMCVRCSSTATGIGVRPLPGDVRRYLHQCAAAASLVACADLEPDGATATMARELMLEVVQSHVGAPLKSLEFVGKVGGMSG